MAAGQYGARHGRQDVGECVLHGVSVDACDTYRGSPLMVPHVDMLVQYRVVR